MITPRTAWLLSKTAFCRCLVGTCLVWTCLVCTCLVWTMHYSVAVAQSQLPRARIKVSDDKTGFVDGEGRPFNVWGVNYDHDESGRLLEDYWVNEWSTVEEDFREIKELGANVVRVHLQLGKFMESAERVNAATLKQLEKLLQLAERTGLYLDLTGLGCYHKSDVPTWYDGLNETSRWEVQRRFWLAVAGSCRTSPAVFCYDLMNEPILPSAKPETEWLAGEFAGKHFVQRIALDLRGRTREKAAAEWVKYLSDAIREVDEQCLITVGAIPWALTFPGAKPIFYSPQANGPLDFVSVHFYPKRGEVDKALEALNVYRIGKPLLVEEFFPLSCTLEEAKDFIDRSQVSGFVSFYWGHTIEQYEQAGDIKGAIVASWLKYFRERAIAVK